MSCMSFMTTGGVTAALLEHEVTIFYGDRKHADSISKMTYVCVNVLGTRFYVQRLLQSSCQTGLQRKAVKL